jgi:hypothetical protein
VATVFDTIAGLPVHALVVHGVVVLLPLMYLVTVAWAFVPSAPARVGYAVVAGNALVVVMTFVARFSGEALHRRLGGNVAVEHGQIATLLPFFALSVLFASVLVQGLRSGGVGVPLRLPGVLTAVVVAVALVWTVRTGHSGSEAVWGEIVRNTSP